MSDRVEDPETSSNYVLDYTKDGLLYSVMAAPDTMGGHSKNPEVFSNYVLDLPKAGLI